MPEGDTLYRTAVVLRRALLDGEVRAARKRPGGVQLERVVGSRVTRVEARGKHLLIAFDVGLTLHTHLGMLGSWHRYRPGERWRRGRDRAVAVIETDTAVAVCFDAPTVELIETRAIDLHPGLARLGPDLLAEPPDIEGAVDRLRSPERASMSIAEALLDQSAMAGIGNVHRSEVLWEGLVSPFVLVGALRAADLRRLLEIARWSLRTGAEQGSRRVHVYGRTGRPCERCGTPIRSRVVGTPPRRVYWCPRCQRPAAEREVS